MALDAIAKTGSLAAGARALQWSQPTIAHHLDALERHLGGQIVIRSVGGSRLTPLGAIALEHCVAILALAGRMEYETGAFVGSESATLRIGVIPTVGAQLLGPALLKLEPRFAVTVTEAENDVLNADVLSGALDVAVVASGPLLNEHGRKTEIGRDRLLLATRSDSTLAEARKVRIADLESEQWILAKSKDDAADRALLYAAKAAGFEPRISRRSDNYLTVLGFVQSGFGVALVPELASRQLPSQVTTVGVEPQIDRTIWAVARPGLTDALEQHVASAFRDALHGWRKTTE